MLQRLFIPSPIVGYTTPQSFNVETNTKLESDVYSSYLRICRLESINSASVVDPESKSNLIHHLINGLAD